MVRIARERVSDLFALAEREALGGHVELADRYVRLARRVGMRYNVRLPREYRDLYCRGCSGFWIEGRTVRTRLRGGRRVRVCLRCGRTRRVPLRTPVESVPGPELSVRNPAPRKEGALAEPLPGESGDDEADDGTEEE